MNNKLFQVLIWLYMMPSLVVIGQENYKDKDTKYDFQNENFYEAKIYSEKELRFKSKPKNVILLIGDGMGLAQAFTGLTANKGQLNLLNFKCIGFSKTQSASNYINYRFSCRWNRTFLW